MTGKDWATLTLAIVGALTGVSSLVWNITTYLLRDRPRLTLSYNHAISINMAHIPDTPIISIEVANRTKHPLTVTSIGFQLSNNTKFAFPTSPYYQLPYEVKPGTNCQAWAIRASLVEDLKKQGLGVYFTHVWANDAVGGTWKKRMPRQWSEQLRALK